METTELQTAHGGTFTWWKNICYFERALKKDYIATFSMGEMLTQLQVFSKAFM